MAARYAIALVCLAGVLAGCGNPDRLSKSAYERQVQPILLDVDSKIFKLGLAVSRAPAPQLAEPRVKTLRATIATSASRLASLEPPEEVDAEHERLVDGLRGLEEELAEAEGAVREPEYQGWPTFLDDLLATEAARAVDGARQAMVDRDYDVGR